MLGEIDILGIKGKKVHVFEVKCSYRIVKAKKQLMRIKKYLAAEDISLFFYCGKSNFMQRIDC
jgi:hypothetical protein